MTSGSHSPERPIPVLIYHSVAAEPPAWIAPYTVSPKTFRAHLDQIVAAGLDALTVSQLADGLAGRIPLPPRPVAITLDDGFADSLSVAALALAERSLPATLYATTRALGGAGPVPATRLGPADMLTWRDLRELEELGVEIGSHSLTHPPLDVVPRTTAAAEITESKKVLEDALGHRVRSFAYPHGFYDRHAKAVVTDAGYESAVAVRNAHTSAADDPMALARLMVKADTPMATIRSWLSGTGARRAPFPVSPATRAWRLWRRGSEMFERRGGAM